MQRMLFVLMCVTLASCAVVDRSYPSLAQEGSAWQSTSYGWLLPATGERLIIFYPGGKVSPEAYQSLLAPLADEGFDLALVRFPLDLAVLSPGKANSVFKQHSAGSAVLMGHSLGAAMAARYSARHPDKVDALVLLAGYSLASAKLEQTALPVLTILGDQDGLISPEEWQAKHHLLPESARKKLMVGGNHAQFGSYGLQQDDRPAQIDSVAQQQQTRDWVVEFLAQTLSP